MRDNWDIAISRQTKRQRERTPYISLNKRGEIAMNDQAFKLIRCPYNVALVYLPLSEENHPVARTTPASGHPSSGRRGAASPPLLETGGELNPPASGRRGVLGVKFPVAQDLYFYPVRRYGRGGRMRIIRAAHALNQFGISTDHTLKFYNPPILYYRNEPMLVLNLSSLK